MAFFKPAGFWTKLLTNYPRSHVFSLHCNFTSAAQRAAVVIMPRSVCSVYVCVLSLQMRSLRWIRLKKPTYLVHQENKTINGRLTSEIKTTQKKRKKEDDPIIEDDQKNEDNPKNEDDPWNEDSPKKWRSSQKWRWPQNEDDPKKENEEFLWHKLSHTATVFVDLRNFYHIFALYPTVHLTTAYPTFSLFHIYFFYALPQTFTHPTFHSLTPTLSLITHLTPHHQTCSSSLAILHLSNLPTPLHPL